MLIAPPAVRPELVDLPQGWFHHGPKVLDLLEQHRPAVVVELGSWLGQSAIAMARVVRCWGGTVSCVDTWSCTLDEHGGSPLGQPPLAIAACARSMVQAGVSASIRLIPASTDDAGARWRGPIDFLYVDADHGYRGVTSDLQTWAPHIAPGGLIVGDDYGNPLYPGVAVAWDEFERQRGIVLTRFQSDPPHPEGIQLVYGTV